MEQPYFYNPEPTRGAFESISHWIAYLSISQHYTRIYLITLTSPWCIANSLSFFILQSLQTKSNASNVTGRHRGPKWNLQGGYRVPSLQHTTYLCITLLHYIFHRRAQYRTRSLGYARIWSL